MTTASRKVSTVHFDLHQVFKREQVSMMNVNFSLRIKVIKVKCFVTSNTSPACNSFHIVTCSPKYWTSSWSPDEQEFTLSIDEIQSIYECVFVWCIRQQKIKSPIAQKLMTFENNSRTDPNRELSSSARRGVT